MGYSKVNTKKRLTMVLILEIAAPIAIVINPPIRNVVVNLLMPLSLILICSHGFKILIFSLTTIKN
jgi:hypothetical protein